MTSVSREAMLGGGDLLINLAEGRDECQSFVTTAIEMPVIKVSQYLVKTDSNFDIVCTVRRLTVCT